MARLPIGLLGLLASGPILSRDFPPTMDVAVLKGDDHQRSHRSGRTRGALSCPSCRVTLSRGECLNRMCRKFVGQA